MAPSRLNFKIYQGSTFREVLRWESDTKVYVPITGISKTAPMVVTATAHGAPEGWRVKIYGAGGMKEINDTTNYIIATGTTANTLTFNSVNALAYTTYTSGGALEYNQPVPLAELTARMQIRSKLASTDIIDELTTANGRIILDTADSIITLTIPADVTAAYTFKTAVYSLELINGAEVIPFIYGNITLDLEVTR
jgi:hypothetical protein